MCYAPSGNDTVRDDWLMFYHSPKKIHNNTWLTPNNMNSSVIYYLNDRQSAVAINIKYADLSKVGRFRHQPCYAKPYSERWASTSYAGEDLSHHG